MHVADPERILQLIADLYPGADIATLNSRQMPGHFLNARIVAVYLLTKDAGLDAQETQRIFSNFSCGEIEEVLKMGKRLIRVINELMKTIDAIRRKYDKDPRIIQPKTADEGFLESMGIVGCVIDEPIKLLPGAE